MPETKGIDLYQPSSLGKFQALDDIQILLERARVTNKTNRRKKTNQKFIKTRPAKGGGTWLYVNRDACQRWLDQHYPVWSWRFDTDKIKESHGWLYGSGELTVLTDEGATRTIQTSGTVEILVDKKGNIVQKHYAKEVDTDSLKRACFTLGAFSDIYTKCPEDDDAFELPDNEDIQWYIETVIPKTKHIMDYRKLCLKFISFLSKDITREYITEQLKEINIDVT